jgi:hypothetical protein
LIAHFQERVTTFPFSVDASQAAEPPEFDDPDQGGES